MACHDPGRTVTHAETKVYVERLEDKIKELESWLCWALHKLEPPNQEMIDFSYNLKVWWGNHIKSDLLRLEQDLKKFISSYDPHEIEHLSEMLRKISSNN
jgi:hypothetical protein